MDFVSAAGLALLFTISFAGLVKGSDIFIEGAASIATRRGVSEHMIGLTLVAFATSIPELAVSDVAAVQGVEGIAIGNVIGSNIANIGLVLGVAIIIMPITSTEKSFRDALYLFGITVILAIFLHDGELSRLDGVIFLVVYVLFLVNLFKNSDVEVPGEVEEILEHQDEHGKDDKKKKGKFLKDWIYVVMGASLVLAGAHFLVESAVEIAEMANVDKIIIGLTIVSIGTSLPELASSVSAALKKKHGISIGNVIGSNMINTLLVLGSASAIKPITGDDMELSMYFLFFFTILCVIAVKLKSIPRWLGIGFLVSYSVFLYSIVV